MFRQLSTQAPVNTRAQILTLHPLRLSQFLEQSWSEALLAPNLATDGIPFPPRNEVNAFSPVGSGNVLDLIGNPQDLRNFSRNSRARVFPAPEVWKHLIYAYLVEATGVVEIVAEVVRRLVAGESLAVASVPARAWARATEELFFQDQPAFAITDIRSDLRPDDRVNRSNAYWRMFGMELPHRPAERWAPAPVLGSTPWKADTGTGVNISFADTFEELLRQVWIGIQNDNNQLGPNQTDADFIALLTRSLRDMLTSRRQRGLLGREEFVYVSALSWFHLSVELDTSPIVQAFNAQSPNNPAEQLRGIASAVGMQPALRSRELFELADPVADLLRAIELGFYNNGPSAQVLFGNLATNPTAQALNRIINLWQSATGRPIKEARVTMFPQASTAAQAIRIPAVLAAPVGGLGNSPNGSTPAFAARP